MDGVILVDKEKGISSFDVIRKLKKILNIKSIGHAGTLDPLATGILIIMIGKATALSNYLMGKDKVYICDILLGVKTNTYDVDGDVISTHEPKVNMRDIERSIEKLISMDTQKPPIYSAIKVNGRKAYEFARKNVEVDLKKRNIKIYSIDILGFLDNTLKLKVHSSKGTYIRSIANDLGDMLGCGACISDLRRVQSGNFFIEDCVKVNCLKAENIEDHLILPEKILNEYDVIKLSNEYNKRLSNGVPIFLDFNDGHYRIYLDDVFWGFGEVNNKRLKIIKKFI